MIEKLSIAQLTQEANKIREKIEEEKSRIDKIQKDINNAQHEKSVQNYVVQLSNNNYLKNLIVEAIIKKERQLRISGDYYPWAKAEAIKLLCPEVSTNVEAYESDMGELNYVTSYSIQIWW